jgi:hypothetical protein
VPEYAQLAGQLKELTCKTKFRWKTREEAVLWGLQAALVKDAVVATRITRKIFTEGRREGWKPASFKTSSVA